MEEDILKKIREQDEKLEKIWRSVEKTRKYFLWTIIATIAMFVIPLIIFLAFVPQILNLYTGNLGI